MGSQFGGSAESSGGERVRYVKGDPGIQGPPGPPGPQGEPGEGTGGGGGGLTTLMVLDDDPLIGVDNKIVVTADLANTHILLLTSDLVTFVFSYQTWVLGDRMKVTMNAAYGAVAMSFINEDFTAFLMGPTESFPTNTTVEITCFDEGEVGVRAATYLVAAYRSVTP